MAGKIIQVPIDDSLLAELDRIARRSKLARAEIIREACRRYLHALREEQLDRVYVAGYERVPDTGAAGATQARIAERVLSEEAW